MFIVFFFFFTEEMGFTLVAVWDNCSTMNFYSSWVFLLFKFVLKFFSVIIVQNVFCGEPFF